MSAHRQHFILGALFLVLLAKPERGLAQGDNPIPYDDPPVQPVEPSDPSKSGTDSPYAETPEAQAEREESLSSRDDPNIGIAFDFMAGILLLEGSRGQGVDSVFGYGGRFTWDFGRIFPGDTVRENLFADFNYLTTSFSGGTQEVYSPNRYHYLTIAPAYAFPFGVDSPVAFYAQLGAGVAYQATELHVDNTTTSLVGMKSLLQYGVGIRGRPLLTMQGKLRLSFRIEATRFRRGYLDDTYFAGSLGLAF